MGNPPYFKIAKENPLTKIIDYEEVRIAGVNAASVFINKALKILKNNGILGFIVPKQLAYTKAWDKIRENVLKTTTINFVIDCHKAFKGVLLEQVIFIIEKATPPMEHIIRIGGIEDNQIIINGEIAQSICTNDNKIYLDYNSMIHTIRSKIEAKSKLLGDIAKVQGGVGVNHLQSKKGVFNQNKKSEKDLIVIKGNDIQRYHLRDRLYFNPNDTNMKNYEGRIENPPIKKIVTQRIVAHIKDHIKITASIDEESSITYDTVTTIKPNDDDQLYLILGILNSKLISYYIYKFIYNNAIRSMDFTPGYASLTPILNPKESQGQEITKIVKDLTDLNFSLVNFDKNIQSIYKKFGGAIKTKLGTILNNNFNKLLVKSDQKKKISDINIKIDGEMLIILVKNKEFLKLGIKDPFMRKYLAYYLESYPCETLKQEKTILSTLKKIEIDDFTDLKSIKIICNELDKYHPKSELENMINALENKLNQKIYEYYELTQEEIEYIEKSFE